MLLYVHHLSVKLDILQKNEWNLLWLNKVVISFLDHDFPSE